MATPIMIVDNYIKWGNLIKSWATGENRLGGEPVPPIPRTIEELKAACSQLKIGITVPSTVTGLAVIQQSENLKVLVLPPKEIIKKKEADLAAGQAYPVPPYIKEITDLDLPIPESRKLDFHAARIGDYTISNCG